MGTLAILSDHSSRTQAEVYAPVNYRPPDTCRLLIFPPGSRERRIYPYEAVQYCTTEVARWGFHVLNLPDGRRGMFWLNVRDDGRLDVRDYQGTRAETWEADAVCILGRVFQLIPDLAASDGERFELIRGPAPFREREDTRRPLYEAKA